MSHQNNNIKSILTRQYTWHRPYYINGKEIEQIIIYKDGEIIYKNHCGWLESVDENFKHSYDADLLEVTIDGDIKRANKENLNRNDNYILKGRRDYSFDKAYILYIHVDNIFFSYKELPKQPDKYLNLSSDYYLYGYSVTMKHDAVINDHYLKYYNRGDVIEECDRGKHFSPDHVKDENGNWKKDENGQLIEDYSRMHCLRHRPVKKRDFVFYNGLYIKEGR